MEDTILVTAATGSAGVQEFANTGGATLIAKSNGYELTVPALGIDTVLPGDGTSAAVTVKTAQFGSPTGNLALGVELHKYLAGGAWTFVATDPQAGILAIVSPFVTGYLTPLSAMPVAGNANYSASGGLVGFVFNRTGPDSGATLSGDVSLTADFRAGSLLGTATNVTATANNSTSAWNNIAVSATIQTAVVNSKLQLTNSFSGTTSAASTPGTAYAVESNAKGYLSGNFFGPNLDEVGAVWSLGNSDYSGAAYGLIGADLSGGGIPPPADQYLSMLFPTTWTFGASTTAIPAPLPATRDNGATPSLFAAPGGPTLDASSGTPLFNGPASPTIIAFPVWMSALEFTSGSIVPVANSAGAFLALFSADGAILSTIDLHVPSLGVQDEIAFQSGNHNPASPASGINLSSRGRNPG